MNEWKEKILETEITEKVTNKTVDFAKRFGDYLGKNDENMRNKLTTNQLRKFFGEIKRQQLQGYDNTDFILLKPKLAYAVGRSDKDNKIKYFYEVMTDAIDKVSNEHQFKNFIKIFEAIVAYHKATEEKRL